MVRNWTRDQAIFFFCLFLPTALMIGTAAYLTDPIAEKAGLLGLLVAYGGLVVVVVNQRQDAEDRKARHDQMSDCLRRTSPLAEKGTGS